MVLRILYKRWDTRRYEVDVPTFCESRGITRFPATSLVKDPYHVNYFALLEDLGPKGSDFIRLVASLPGIKSIMVAKDHLEVEKKKFRLWRGIEPWLLKTLKDIFFPNQELFIERYFPWEWEYLKQEERRPHKMERF